MTEQETIAAGKGTVGADVRQVVAFRLTMRQVEGSEAE
jgi:hypothetical protein